MKYLPRKYPCNISVLRMQYLGRVFDVPIYPWPALEAYWPIIVADVSKALIYNRFGSRISHHHQTWRGGRESLEALRFLDVLSRSRGFSWAVRKFNRQIEGLKHGGSWLDPVYGLAENYRDQLAILGQFIHNIVKFLLDMEYLIVHESLALKVVRPYWCPPASWRIRQLWGIETFRFIREYARGHGSYPSLGVIADYWKVSKSVLVDAGLTRPVIYSAYKNWRETGKVKFSILKIAKVLSVEDQEKIAKEIVRRVYGEK